MTIQNYHTDLVCFENAVSSSSGNEFFAALNSCCMDVDKKILKWYQEWKTSLLMDTFFTCLSLHHPSEDDNGRLSMWRAYGNVAIVLNNSILVNESSALGVDSLRVNYFSQVEYERYISRMAESIRQHREIIAQAGEPLIERGVYNLFLSTAIGTKHPGFTEEKEYRAYANPSHHTTSKKIVKKIDDIRRNTTRDIDITFRTRPRTRTIPIGHSEYSRSYYCRPDAVPISNSKGICNFIE